MALDFHSDIGVNLDGTDENDLYVTMEETILEKIATYLSKKSKTRLHSIRNLELHTVTYNPLKAGTWFPLPKELADKKAIINVKNKDDKFFLWCVFRALYPKDKDPQRITDLINNKDTLNLEGIEYPVTLKDVNKFEKQNPTLSTTVLGYEGKGVYPLRNSGYIDREHNIFLMLLEKDGVKHYSLVKSLDRLLSSQGAFSRGKKYFCLRCLNYFWSENVLNNHQEYCKEHAAVKIKLPKKGYTLEFKNFQRSEKVPFIVYADFESYIQPIQSCGPNPESSYTKQYQKHEPSSFCYYVKCFDDEVYPPKSVTYTGENVAETFVKMLEMDIRKITGSPYQKMIFGDEERERFEKESEFRLCK